MPQNTSKAMLSILEGLDISLATKMSNLYFPRFKAGEWEGYLRADGHSTQHGVNTCS